MLLSMTGYGKAESPFMQAGIQKKLVVELRGLNSKTMDISMRLSPLFREKDLEIRALLTQRLERGKIDCSVFVQESGGNANVFPPINFAAVSYYQKQIEEYCKNNHQPLPNDWWPILMGMPEVMHPVEQDEISDEDWKTLQSTLSMAIDAFVAFRQQEGDTLQRIFTEKLDGITTLLQSVEVYEKERVQKIRTRLEDNLHQLSEATQQAIDKNRLEQEMIYYLEKLDIDEEKVRLRNHIRYFLDTMAEQGAGVGKKLGFVAQEMGREINTLGSKSNQAEMQIIVVKMKDLLEQIKEQVLNVL